MDVKTAGAHETPGSRQAAAAARTALPTFVTPSAYRVQWTNSTLRLEAPFPRLFLLLPFTFQSKLWFPSPLRNCYRQRKANVKSSSEHVVRSPLPLSTNLFVQTIDAQ